MDAPEAPDVEEKKESGRIFGTARREERVETKAVMGRTAVVPVDEVRIPLSGCRTSDDREEDVEDAQMTVCCGLKGRLPACSIRRRKTSKGIGEDDEEQC